MTFLDFSELEKILKFQGRPGSQVSGSTITFTLSEVHQIVGEAQLGQDESDTKEARRIKRPSRRSSGEKTGWWDLGPGIYWITFNERVEIPPSCLLVIQPHTRILGNGVWHPVGLIRDWDQEMDGLLLTVSSRGVRASENTVISRGFVLRLG